MQAKARNLLPKAIRLFIGQSITDQLGAAVK